MKRSLVPLALLASIALAFVVAPLAQTMRTVNTTNELVMLSPYTINTNTYVVTEGSIGDGTATWWTFVAGDATGPDATHLQPILYPTAGRWVKNTGGSGGTNIFNTIITTNLYSSNLYVTNLTVISNFVSYATNVFHGKTTFNTNIYITTNTYITYNGFTNQAGLWEETNGVIRHIDPLPVEIWTELNFGDGGTNVVKRSNGGIYYTNNAATFYLDPTYPCVTVSNATATANFGLSANIPFVSGNSTLEVFGGNIGVIMSTGSSAIYPMSGGIGESLGLPTKPFGNFYSQSTNYTAGFWDNTGTNYSRLAISHGGTNGVINFDSQSAGTAGAAREFNWRTNNVLQMALSDGALTVYSPDLGDITSLLPRGLLVRNTTADTGVAPQSSPSVIWEGQGWDSGTASSKSLSFGAYVQTFWGGPSGTWRLQSWTNGFAPTTQFAISSASGYSGTGTNYLKDDGTYGPVTAASTNSANWLAVGAADSTLAGTATVDTMVIKHSPVIDLFAFGAVEDGGTDDTAAWNAALAYLATTNNTGTILVQGNSKVAAAGITIPAGSDIAIIGTGRTFPYTKSVITGVAGGKIFTLGNGIGQFALRNINLVTASNAVEIPDGSQVSNINFENVLFSGISSKAIAVLDSTKSGGIIVGSAVGCEFYGVLYGFYAATNALVNNFSFERCSFANMIDGGYGVAFEGLDNNNGVTAISLANCLFNGTSSGTTRPIKLGRSVNVRIESAHFADFGLTPGVNNDLELITLSGDSSGVGPSLLSIVSSDIQNARGPIFDVTATNISLLYLANNTLSASGTGYQVITNANRIANLTSIENRWSADTAITNPVAANFIGDQVIGTPLPQHFLSGLGNVGKIMTDGVLGVQVDSPYAPHLVLSSQATFTPGVGLDIWYDGAIGTSYVDARFNNDAGNIKLRTKVSSTPIEALTILGSGKIGVMTNAPSEALEVLGKAKATAFFVAGTTNQVIFGATNTAPVSSAAPTKWISVQVQGEAAVYRLPLYE